MKKIKLTIKSNTSRSKKMSAEELEKYYNEVRKSHHVFTDRSKFNKKRSRQERFY